MKSNSTYALTYTPAYVGLFFALLLAAICNAFLDIQYGSFGFEVFFWSLLFALTLWIGWRQRGELSPGGKRAQKWVLVIGLILTLVIFKRLWGFPRAGLALLLMLQAAQNCVCVSRRQLYLGLLVSLVAVVFAAAHFRSDWTMLFYLLPYIVAVVFTLVAEQINRRAQEVQRDSLGRGVVRGQGAAIAFATVIILTVGALLYSVTPQVTWSNLFWSYGQPGNVGGVGKIPGLGQGNQPGSPGQGLFGTGGEANAGSGGLSVEDMREAARRPGMPRWQAQSIEAMADATEGVVKMLQPLWSKCTDWWEAFKEWLKQHQQALMRSLFALLALLLLAASWVFIRELRLVVWLRVQLDYLWLVRLRQVAAGNRGAHEVYRALQRLLDLHELEPAPAANSREYLGQICQQFRHLGDDARAITLIYEQARFGNREVSATELASMLEAYRRLCRHVDIINNALAA